MLSDPTKRARYDQLGGSYSQWQRGGAPGNFDWGQWASSQGGTQEVNLDDLFGDGTFSDFFRSIFGGSMRRAGYAWPQFAGASRHPATGAPSPCRRPSRHQPHPADRQPACGCNHPARVRTGTKVRVQGALPSSSGGPPRTYISSSTSPRTPPSSLTADDLHTHVTIGALQGDAGRRGGGQDLSGKVVLTIPAGTQPDQVFRVGARGR